MNDPGVISREQIRESLGRLRFILEPDEFRELCRIAGEDPDSFGLPLENASRQGKITAGWDAAFKALRPAEIYARRRPS